MIARLRDRLREVAVRALAISVLLLLASGAPAAEAPSWMMLLEVDGRTIEGKPLTWSAERVILLGRDGYLWSFSPSAATNYQRTSDHFRAYSQSDMRGHLMREFGRGFEVSGTGHYLVVHPAGQRDEWAPRFETLYRSFVHYFTARGLRPAALELPLVAVVFSSRSDYQRYAARNGANLPSGSLGYYCPTSNRILMYDVTRQSAGYDWHVNAQTIIHEAAHQCAFNTGIHSRHQTPPRWVVEGLGTMFEARGVWNAAQFPQQRDRINRELLAMFKRSAAQRRSGALAELVANDRLFNQDSSAAYAEAWALTFFLAETQPRQYLDYLRLTAEAGGDASYSAPERLRDFQQTFGQNLALLEAQYLRFIHQLDR